MDKKEPVYWYVVAMWVIIAFGEFIGANYCLKPYKGSDTDLVVIVVMIVLPVLGLALTIAGIVYWARKPKDK